MEDTTKNGFYDLPANAEAWTPDRGFVPVAELQESVPAELQATGSFTVPRAFPSAAPGMTPLPAAPQSVSVGHGELPNVTSPPSRETPVPAPVLPSAPRLMSVGDIYALQDSPASAPIEKVFILQGQPFTFQVSSEITRDPQQYMAFAKTLSGGKPELDAKGQLILKPLEVLTPPPHVKKLVITDADYIANLRVCAAACLAPTMTVEEWAIFGDKIGARGAQAGWSGIQDITAWVLESVGMTAKAVQEEETHAGEGPVQAG